MNLTLIDAFRKFGAIPKHRLRGLSAIAADGAMVLSCSEQHFANPSPGVLRYEDRLSREAEHSPVTGLLGQHLTLARDGALPVRMVVAFRGAAERSAATRSYHVRPDLVGQLVMFDGDHFIVDFTRPAQVGPETVAKRRKSSRGMS